MHAIGRVSASSGAAAPLGCVTLFASYDSHSHNRE